MNNTMKEKILPNNISAEQGILGAIFIDGSKMLQARDKLKVDDLFDIKHKIIYKAMLELHDDGKMINFVSLNETISERDKATSGGFEYLIELSEFLPSTAHFNSHLNIVLDLSLKRRLINVAGEILQDAYDNSKDVKELLPDAEEKIFDLSRLRSTDDFIHMSKVFDDVHDKIIENKHKKDGVTGLTTGFNNLDEITAGLQPEELMILAARPAMGKSAFALNLALNTAKLNKNGKANIAIFSLEMGYEQLGSRIISNESDVKSGRLKTGDLDSRDWANLLTSGESLRQTNIMFDDSASLTIGDIRSKCRKYHDEGRLDFVIIDYLQLIKGDGRNGNRQQEVAHISRGLKQLARELKVPVLALSQLSRAVELRDDKRPVLADLRESGSIEQDADIVMFLYRDDYYEKDKEKKNGIVDLSIAKNRQGQSGIVLNYIFEPEYSKFRETKIEKEYDF